MIGRVLDLRRRVRLALWAARTTLRLRRLGMRADIAIAPDVRFETLPLVEIDAFSPAEGGGSLGILIGRGVRLGRDLTIDVRLGGENSLTIGEGSVVQSWCRLQLHGGEIDIGKASHLRDLVQVKTKSLVTIGDRVVLSRDVIVHGTAGVTIGDDCGIGERTSIIDSDHELEGAGEAFLRAPVRAEPVVLGRGVAVSANCVILRGARLGDGAALAAGAVLNGDEVPAGHLAGGMPARVIRDLRA